jgi:hypothetical protein
VSPGSRSRNSASDHLTPGGFWIFPESRLVRLPSSNRENARRIVLPVIGSLTGGFDFTDSFFGPRGYSDKFCLMRKSKGLIFSLLSWLHLLSSAQRSPRRAADQAGRNDCFAGVTHFPDTKISLAISAVMIPRHRLVRMARILFTRLRPTSAFG